MKGDEEEIRKLCGEINNMNDDICEMSKDGKGKKKKDECLDKRIKEKLGKMCEIVKKDVIGVEKYGMKKNDKNV